MKITEFEFYVCGLLLLRVFSGRAPSADCAVCGAGVRAGRGAVRGGVGGQYGGHATMLHVAAPLIHTPATLHLAVFVS